MKYVYPAMFFGEERGSYSVIFPDLQGLITQGDNLYEALSEAQDALEFWLDYLEDTGEEIPPPTALSQLEISAPDFVNLIRADTDEWRKRNARRAS